MTDDQKWQRDLALAKSGGVCEVCHRPLMYPQGAHRIANTQMNREKYGSFVIDSVENIAIVCSLHCNDMCNVGNNPGEVLKIIKKIVERESKKYGN